MRRKRKLTALCIIPTGSNWFARPEGHVCATMLPRSRYRMIADLRPLRPQAAYFTTIPSMWAGRYVNSRFDLAVVGGGPAGCAAAIWAAKCGLQTVLMEAREFPRKRPGETLHPGVEALF